MSPREDALAKIKTMTRDDFWAPPEDGRSAITRCLPMDEFTEWMRYVQGIAAEYIPLETAPSGRIRMARDLPPPRAAAGEGT